MAQPGAPAPSKTLSENAPSMPRRFCGVLLNRIHSQPVWFHRLTWFPSTVQFWCVTTMPPKTGASDECSPFV